MHFSWIGSNLSFHCKQTIVADWFRGSLIASRKNAKSDRSVAEQAARVCFRNVFPSRTCDLSPSCVVVLFDRCEPLSLNAITPFDVRRPERYESYRKDVKFFTDRALCLPHLLSAIYLFLFSISLILSLFFPLLFQTGVCGHQHKFIRHAPGCVGRGCGIIKN